MSSEWELLSIYHQLPHRTLLYYARMHTSIWALRAQWVGKCSTESKMRNLRPRELVQDGWEPSWGTTRDPLAEKEEGLAGACWTEHGMVQRQESQLCAPRHEMTFDDRRSQHRIIDNLCKLASPLTGTWALELTQTTTSHHFYPHFVDMSTMQRMPWFLDAWIRLWVSALEGGKIFEFGEWNRALMGPGRPFSGSQPYFSPRVVYVILDRSLRKYYGAVHLVTTYFVQSSYLQKRIRFYVPHQRSWSARE